MLFLHIYFNILFHALIGDCITGYTGFSVLRNVKKTLFGPRFHITGFDMHAALVHLTVAGEWLAEPGAMV